VCRSSSTQQNVYASLGFSVAIKFCFLNFAQQRRTVTRFENPSRHKHKRCAPCWNDQNKMQRIKIIFRDDNHLGPYFPYDIEITNGAITVNFEIFEQDFKEFGNKLKQFPIVQFADTDFSATYRHGTKSRDFQYRFSLHVSIYKTNGHPALNVKLESNWDHPYSNNADFSITTVPYSIVTLGTMLYDWDPRIQKELIWEAE
jgi:hypothetical protein